MIIVEMGDLMRNSDLLRDKIAFLEEHAPQSEEIALLKKKLGYSKRGRSSKTKGATYERKIVKFLNEQFPALTFGRTPSSGGYKKELESNTLRGDVVCLDDNVDFALHLELKNRKAGWKVVQDWFKQAEDDCIKGKYPCLVMHQSQEKGKYRSEDFIMLKLKDFFNIVDKKLLVRGIDKTRIL